MGLAPAIPTRQCVARLRTHCRTHSRGTVLARAAPRKTSARRQSPPPAKEEEEFRPGVDADAIPERDLDDDELAALLGTGPELDEAGTAVLREKVKDRGACVFFFFFSLSFRSLALA
jgi:hypothetical protein